MFGRLLRNIGNIVLVLLLAALPGSLLVGLLTPRTYVGFFLGMLYLLPFAAAALMLASPFLILLRLLGHRSWWSRVGLAACAGAFCGLVLGYMPDSDTPRDAITAFNPRAAALGAGFGAVFGLWAGAWWCLFFRDRPPRRPDSERSNLPVGTPAARA